MQYRVVAVIHGEPREDEVFCSPGEAIEYAQHMEAALTEADPGEWRLYMRQSWGDRPEDDGPYEAQESEDAELFASSEEVDGE
jgi:hypothetical protein